jgi:PRTRC genetic system protein B
MTIEKKMIPYKALVLYKDNRDESGIEYAEITEYESGIPISSYPATKEFFKEIGKSYVEAEQQSYSANLLAKGKPVKLLGFKIGSREDCLVFVTYPQKRKLLFRDKNLSGYHHIPALVWKADRSSLYVYAVMDHNDLNDMTKLYMAPFMNLDKVGRVCLGSSYWPETFKDNMFGVCKKISDGFFDSMFTHFNVTQVSKSNYFTVLENLKSLESFPKDELIDMERNLKDFMDGIL